MMRLTISDAPYDEEKIIWVFFNNNAVNVAVRL